MGVSLPFRRISRPRASVGCGLSVAALLCNTAYCQLQHYSPLLATADQFRVGSRAGGSAPPVLAGSAFHGSVAQSPPLSSPGMGLPGVWSASSLYTWRTQFPDKRPQTGAGSTGLLSPPLPSDPVSLLILTALPKFCHTAISAVWLYSGLYGRVREIRLVRDRVGPQVHLAPGNGEPRLTAQARALEQLAHPPILVLVEGQPDTSAMRT